MQLLTLYARREPSPLRELSPITPQRRHPARWMDVVLYRDQAASRQAGYYPWYLTSVPTRRSTHVMHNCFRYALQWLDDLSFDSNADLIAHREAHLRFWPGARVVPVCDVNGQRALAVLL